MNALRDKRKSQGFSLKDVADHIGVSRQMIHYYEKGEKIPTLRRLEQLADFYGTTTDELLGRGNDGMEKN